MIPLDTNILSALTQTAPEPAVVAWLDRQPPEDIWTTTISVFEIRFGLALPPFGRGRHTMEAAFEMMLEQDLRSRIATFDLAASEAAALLAARRRQNGRLVDFRDTQIAGIALASARASPRGTSAISRTSAL